MSASSSSPTEGVALTTPRCSHFGECGGCRLQDTAYEAQVARKAEILLGLLGRIDWSAPVQVHPSPETWYYRNKMEFSFQDVYPAPAAGEPHLRLGLKVRNRWDKVMDLSECHLFAPDAAKLLAAVRGWALRERLEPYNLHRHHGFLRHLVVREGKNTGQRMVNLVTHRGELPEASFVEAVLSASPAHTVLWSVNDGKADVAAASETKVLHGPGHIEEVVLGRTLRISPYSFFQTNTRGAELLYGLIRGLVSEIRPANLLDLYCGGGGIGLCLADLCGRVMGVDVVESAVEDARCNARANGIANAEYVAAKTEDILPGLAAQKIDVDVVVVDPPRCGLHPGAVQALKDLAAPWVIYVSCNPKALAEDLKRLSELYDVARIEGVDLFPHTDHLEALALLKRVY